MNQPLIGITTYNATNDTGLPAILLLRTYVDAILRAGATPILIPSELPETNWIDLYQRLDGILFSGGGDIALERYRGEEHHRVYGVDELRDTLEISLMKMAVDGGKPFFGICRGSQVMNVALGGSLYSHVEDQLPGSLKHDYFPDYPRDLLIHQVRIEEESKLAKILGEPIMEVNSLHHQGLKDIGQGLQAVAFAPDGLVEAIEVPDHPFGLAVQWHPEWLTHDGRQMALFKAFVAAAAGN